jgi:hypothetical protein
VLPVICGTDTLGVGVNVPIRTVLMTALTKFDGDRVRVFTAREFHQLAGRAGRPGFDPDGHVWAQAPEHVIDNERALAKAGDDPKARRKATKSQPPKGFVHYDERTFERLRAAAPEALVSRFRVSADLVSSVLARPDGSGPAALKDLLRSNHDAPNRRRRHVRRAIAVYRSLEAAGLAERRRDGDGRCAGVRVGDLQADETLRLSSPLAPFAVEVIATLDRAALDYELDVLSIVESTIEDPRQILFAQQNAARAAEVARLKAEGVPYEERVDLVADITWPRPQSELLDACFDTYRRAHPWIERVPSPKSIVREMVETGETFAGFVHRYRLDRSEGLVLRYLSDCWRALDRALPADVFTDRLEDVVEWLSALIKATDASLIEEWERLAGLDPSIPPDDAAVLPPSSGPPAAWRTVVRTAVFAWVDLLAAGRDVVLAERLDDAAWPAERITASMAAYRREHDAIATDAEARSAAWFTLTEHADRWSIEQILVDPDASAEWGLGAEVDLVDALDSGAPTLRLVALGRRHDTGGGDRA